MLIFNKVIIKNFFSVGNVPITIMLNKSPTTAVVGKNGEGKSSCILDSIYFACFGKPFRNINIPNVVNSINNSDCVVELFLKSGTKEYRVVRGLKPKVFEIWENDVLLDQDAHSKDYQDHLEKYVLGGMNERIFKQIVIMGSANFTPFMQLPSAARREVIEELLDIKIFSNMLDIVKARLITIKENLVEMDNGIVLVQEKVNIHEENQKRVEIDIEAKRQDIGGKVIRENEDIAVLNKEIADITTKKSVHMEQYKNFDAITLLRKTVDKESIEFANHIKTAKRTIEFFTSHTACPTCTQPIDETHKVGLLFTAQKEFEVQKLCLDKANEKLTGHDAVIKALGKVKLLMEKCDKDIFKKQTEISTKQKYISTIQKEILQTDKTTKAISVDVESLKKSLLQLKEKRIVILEERQYYEVIAGLLKDGGIKTKIIRQYIPVFNKLINEYLVRFGLPIEFTLDAEFNEIIKSRYRDKFQYNNLSEGEKSRVDLALLFAWRQIAKSKNTLNVNLMIFDEVFDSHLDANATEELLNMLLEMDKHTNIFVISHKQNLEDKLRSVIRFEKRGNFTVMT